MSLLNKMLYPVELVSAKHEKFINKKKGEIMFPGRIFFKILSKHESVFNLKLLKANEYNQMNCYIHPKTKYGYAIDKEELVTLFFTKKRYINGVIKSAILNGAKSFPYDVDASSINKDNGMVYDKLIKQGLKPRYE